jgi:ribosomal-protein-alanine N-acetyltransferase
VNIRPFKNTDLEAVCALENAIFPNPKPKEVFVEDEHKYTVIEENGKIVGYAGFEKILDEGHIINMAVAESTRGKGFGRSLMENILKEAEKEKMTRLILEVRVSNQPAISLYEKMGFEVIAKRKHYYENNNEDALVMAKKL